MDATVGHRRPMSLSRGVTALPRAIAQIVIVGVIASSLVWFGAPSAMACSCVEQTQKMVGNSPGAFVGTVTDKTSTGDNAFIATIEVDRDLKDNLDDTIYVESFEDTGANCGLSIQTGSQIATTIETRSDGTFETNGCSQIPDAVLEAWEPSVGIGGVAEAFRATAWGPYRIVAVDAEARPIAYGTGLGQTLKMGICEGDQSLVEIVRQGGLQQIEIRDLNTFEIVASYPLPDNHEAKQVECGSDFEADLAVVAKESGQGGARSVFAWDGQAFAPVDREEPVTRGREWLKTEPSATTERGVVVNAESQFSRLYELPMAINVPATGAGFEPQLGAGVAPSSGRWLYIAGAIAIAALGALALLGLLRRRSVPSDVEDPPAPATQQSKPGPGAFSQEL